MVDDASWQTCCTHLHQSQTSMRSHCSHGAAADSSRLTVPSARSHHITNTSAHDSVTVSKNSISEYQTLSPPLGAGLGKTKFDLHLPEPGMKQRNSVLTKAQTSHGAAKIPIPLNRKIASHTGHTWCGFPLPGIKPSTVYKILFSTLSKNFPRCLMINELPKYVQMKVCHPANGNKWPMSMFHWNGRNHRNFQNSEKKPL